MTARPNQEVEVRAEVGLQHVLAVEADVSSVIGVAHWAPRGTPAVELGGVDLDVQTARFDIEADDVARADKGERTADVELGRDMQDDGPVGGSAHPTVGDPHHVAHPLTKQSLGDGQVPTSGIPG